MNSSIVKRLAHALGWLARHLDTGFVFVTVSAPREDGASIIDVETHFPRHRVTDAYQLREHSLTALRAAVMLVKNNVKGLK